MSNVQQTSLLAYKEAKQKLNQKQNIVLYTLQQIHPATNLDIAHHLGWAINSVTPRVHELRAKKLVVEAKKAIDPRTGRKSMFWRPNKQPVEFENE